MNSVVLTKLYEAPPICEREILRYAGCGRVNGETAALLSGCISEIRDKLAYKVCYCRLPLEINGSCCRLGDIEMQSEKLAVNLKDCKTAILFAATVGIEIDRLIAKYGRLSPSKALMLQAIGAERIEALCDTFCSDMAAEYSTAIRPRFSPGYGDLPLSVQKAVFAALMPEKRIGVALNSSLLMSPSKSVTAVLGLGGDEIKTQNKCSVCNMTSCAFRGAL